MYIIFISQNLSAITKMWGLYLSPEIAGILNHYLIFHIAVGCFFVLVPMVFVRDVSKLSSLMMIATLCMLFTLVLVMYYGSKGLIFDGPAHDVEYIIKPDSCLVFIGMASFLFGKIGVVVPIRDIMQKKSEFTGCLLVSLWSIFGIFSAFGIVGYAAWGRHPDIVKGGGMVTLALDQGKPVVQVTELFFMLSLIPSFVLMIYVPIKIWENGFFSHWTRSSTRTWTKNLWRAIAVGFICYIAIATSKTFDKVMAIFGSCFGGPTTYIWPAIFHLVLIKEQTLKQRLTNYLLLLVGCAASGFTLYKTIVKLMG